MSLQACSGQALSLPNGPDSLQLLMCRAVSKMVLLTSNRPSSKETGKLDGVFATTAGARTRIVGCDTSHHFLPTATTVYADFADLCFTAKYADKPSIFNYQLPIPNYQATICQKECATALIFAKISKRQSIQSRLGYFEGKAVLFCDTPSQVFYPIRRFGADNKLRNQRL